MPHIPKAVWAPVFLAVTLVVGITIGLGVTGRLERFLEPILVYLFDDSPAPPRVDPTLSLVPWPVIDPAMREAFDRAAKKTLYREDCRCLTWVSGNGTIKRAEWPPTDDDRREIMTDSGLTPFNAPHMPRMPRQPRLGI